MPRKPRYIEPGVVYHLISRFVDRDWYIQTNTEREYYLTLLGRSLLESDWRCLSYGIMSNHVHISLVAGKQPLDAWIRRIHSPFADWLNRTRERIGTIFVRGPKDYATPRERVAHLIAYIHNNPVRAKVVATATESAWTSHRAYMGLVRAPRWLHVDEGMGLAGFTDAMSFDRWTSTAARDPDAELVERERQILEPTNARASGCTGWRARARGDHTPDEVVKATADELGLSLAAVHSRRRGPREVLARRVAAHCGDSLGLSGVSMAKALGLSQQNVSWLLRRQQGSTELEALTARVVARLGPNAIG